ncbi:hypothetical protein PHYPSEUDO_003588 [Phytophthora pseudosyringae]|uniref:PDZ domain-containing protein n=1 Tax=Phytophthora pseudosyringae TaxID=221518 RepID=A0A8T1VQZ4_9STRA|nr:hypothetical protein PHYPSEUDO_003588 [Phytophthora pseudosyringae]
MAHPASTGSPCLSSHAAAALTSDTVVFSHTKAQSRQSSVVAGTASPVGAYRAPPGDAPATLARAQAQPQLNKFRVEAPRGARRMMVRVLKHGNKLGFGVRHDRYKRLQVSTLQGGGESQLRVGDTLLAVNGADLTGHEFLTVIQHLKATRPGELVFDIERVERGRQQDGDVAVSAAARVDATSHGAAIATPSHPPPAAATVAPAAAVRSVSASQAYWSQNGDNATDELPTGRTLVPQTGAPPPSIPVTSGPLPNGAQRPRKRARPAQRAVTMLDDNGQPVNVTALLADLKKERAEKAALEEKNTGLRKRLQRMLIENDEVRVLAKNEVVVAQETAKREVAEAQNQLAAARAQLRLKDRGPDVARIDSIANELIGCKAQLERLKKAEADRTEQLTTRYRGECRVAAIDAQRVLDSVVGMFRTKLRQVGRMSRDDAGKAELEVACDGVRRLAFMKLFHMACDFAFYTSAAYQSQEPVHHTLEQEQFLDLFGNSLCHEERAGVFFVATAPMLVVFDPNAESLVLKCEWAEQNALRELARSFRF